MFPRVPISVHVPGMNAERMSAACETDLVDYGLRELARERAEPFNHDGRPNSQSEGSDAVEPAIPVRDKRLPELEIGGPCEQHWTGALTAAIGACGNVRGHSENARENAGLRSRGAAYDNRVAVPTVRALFR